MSTPRPEGGMNPDRRRRRRRVAEGTASDPLLVMLVVVGSVTCLIFVVGQQVPAPWPWFHDAGQLAYDLSLAYIAAYVFFVLVQAWPLQREREVVLRHQLQRCERLIDGSRQLISAVASEHPDMRVTPHVTPTGPGAIIVDLGSGPIYGRWLDRFAEYLRLHDVLVQRILLHERLTPAVLVAAVESLDQSAFVTFVRALVSVRHTAAAGGERIDVGLVDHAELCDELERAIQPWIVSLSRSTPSLR